METQVKENWIKALRSGEFTQIKGSYYDSSKSECFCAMGLLPKSNNMMPSLASVMALGADLNTLEDVVKMNDKENKSFEEIADWIEQNL